MKKIWMRIGAEVELTDRQYTELLEAYQKRNCDKLENIIMVMIYSCMANGETYIPSKDDLDSEKYDNPDEEISVLLF